MYHHGLSTHHNNVETLATTSLDTVEILDNKELCKLKGNPSKMETIGEFSFVLYKEVSLVKGNTV